MREKEVLKESTGWRDLELSARHRTWGYGVPCIDLDFPLCEFDHFKPRALIEYKVSTAPWDRTMPGLRVLVALGNMSGLPAFLVRYRTDFSKFKVHPLNEMAENLTEVEVLTEEEYVQFLHKIRQT